MSRFVTTKIIILLLYIPGAAMAQTTPPATPTTEQPRQRPPEQMIENNGLKGNLGVHDPCMIKAGDTYYVFSTGMGIKTSKDMITWTNAGSVFERGAPPLPWWNDDIKDKVSLWAPDIHYADGQYHLYY